MKRVSTLSPALLRNQNDLWSVNRSVSRLARKIVCRVHLAATLVISKTRPRKLIFTYSVVS